MAIDKATIQRVANLARIGVSEDELARFSAELTRIFEVIAQIDHVDASGVAPMAHSNDAIQRLREDMVTEKNERDLMQTSAPKTLAGLYLVPKVIE